MWLIEFVIKLIPPAIELLFFKSNIRPAIPPVVPPLIVNNAEPEALLFVKVVVPVVLFSVIAPETVRADAVLFSVIAVTFAPIPALIKVVPPTPVPELVIVPALSTEVPDKVILLAVVLLFCKIKFPVPVTLPVTVKELFKASTIKVVAVELTAIAPIDNAEDVALCCI